MKVNLVVQQTGTMDEFRRKFQEETGWPMWLFIQISFALHLRCTKRDNLVWVRNGYFLELRADYPVYKLYKIERDESAQTCEDVQCSSVLRNP